MPKILKCPASTCTFRFDAALVPPGALIACPQCRRQFTLGPTAAQQLEPDVEHTPHQRELRQVLSKAEAYKGKTSQTGLLVAVAVVGFVLLGIGGFLGLGFTFGWFGGGPNNTTPKTVAGAKFENYGITIPAAPAGWQADVTTRTSFGVNLLAYKRTQPDGWMAFEAAQVEFAAKSSDLKMRLVSRLRNRFDDLDDVLEPTEVTFLGVPGEKYEFGGSDKLSSQRCRGEVWACVSKNSLYWMYAWWQKDDFTDLAAIEQVRIGIVAQPSGPALATKPKNPERVFRGSSGAFQIADSEGLWTQQPDPTLQNAEAQLLLKGVGRNATSGKPGNEKANLNVVLLKPDGDAREQAMAHVLKTFTEGGDVEEVAGPADGDAPSSGDVTTTDFVQRRKLTYPNSDASVNKLLVFAVVDHNDQRIVAYGDCPLNEKRYWEQRLMLIIGTLKAGR